MRGAASQAALCCLCYRPRVRVLYWLHETDPKSERSSVGPLHQKTADTTVVHVEEHLEITLAKFHRFSQLETSRGRRPTDRFLAHARRLNCDSIKVAKKPRDKSRLIPGA
jgi:hypothetical protein